MHVTLDGFVAGPEGQMDWIKLDNELWDYVTEITDAADSALYGAHTYKMMEDYWPTAGQKPNASQHDIDHAKWANNAHKYVFSKTLQETNWDDHTTIVHDDILAEITKLKAQPGKNLLMLGSPSLAHSFMQLGLIDEYRLNVNPVIIGAGIPLFKDIPEKMNLTLGGTKAFASGVVGLHYDKS